MLTTNKRCYFCGKTTVQLHHIYGGRNRKISDRNGFTVWLCAEHHTGNKGVHNCEEMSLILKKKQQEQYEKTHTRQEFIELIGRSYL